MYSPPGYSTLKIGFKQIIENDYRIQFDEEEMKRHTVAQFDNMLMRQIRLLTGDMRKFNKYIIFVECAGAKTRQKEMRKLIYRGFKVNKQEFVMSERSASMTRSGILSFVDKRIARDLDLRVTMGMEVGETSISKYTSYRGLMLSSCHCIEGWVPKIIVVPDKMLTIQGQNIRYVCDRSIHYQDTKTGEDRIWKQKDIARDTRDIEINAFDGCGIAHPDIMREIAERIGTTEKITSAILRGPGLKGVIHAMDYQSFYAERGVESVKDIWGVEHDVGPGAEPMVILTEGQYKFYKYFNKTGTSADWDEYWNQFYKNQHCIGVAKWNYQIENEPLYTRMNYQVLQDLDLPYEKFQQLANYSVDWYEKISCGDPVYVYCFLGMFADRHKPLNNYCEAVLKNPEMLKEEGVRKYIKNLMKKYREEFNCGKLWLKATFKFMAPDLIMLMEHIAGLPLKGCLEEDEFYSFDRNGILEGERLIERNPHICKSEHVILKCANNDVIEKYCGHLANVAMINCKSITPQRLNGAD